MGRDKWHHQAVIDTGQMASANSKWETNRAKRPGLGWSGKASEDKRDKHWILVYWGGGAGEQIVENEFKDDCVK